MRSNIKFLFGFLLVLIGRMANAECDRIPYEFHSPDEFIKHTQTLDPNPRGTVIISHGGTSGRAGPLSQGWASFFNANGFDAIVLNHYPQRGLISRSCKASLAEAANWRRDDTFAVLQWLNKSNSKAAENIVIAGFSAGAAAVFPFVTDTTTRANLPSVEKIRAGVVFYPWANGCMNPPSRLVANTIFIAATGDNVYRCWKSSLWLETSLKEKMTISVIQGALHAFDNPSMKERTCSTEGKYPYCMEYDRQAHQQSEKVLIEYLNGLGL